MRETLEGKDLVKTLKDFSSINLYQKIHSGKKPCKDKNVTLSQSSYTYETSKHSCEWKPSHSNNMEASLDFNNTLRAESIFVVVEKSYKYK